MRKYCDREQRPLPERWVSRSNSTGYSLVEICVVIAIISVLAAVAIPTYITYINRSRQADAISALLLAQQQQAAFWSDPSWSGLSNTNPTYASRIGCLPSFYTSGNTACLTASSCNNSCNSTYTTAYGYVVQVLNAGTGTFTIQAKKTVNGALDILTVSDTNQQPQITTPGAMGFSLFKMVFGQ